VRAHNRRWVEEQLASVPRMREELERLQDQMLRARGRLDDTKMSPGHITQTKVLSGPRNQAEILWTDSIAELEGVRQRAEKIARTLGLIDRAIGALDGEQQVLIRECTEGNSRETSLEELRRKGAEISPRTASQRKTEAVEVVGEFLLPHLAL